jgi:NADP-dependent aldehyde dehydrogenase
MRLTGKQLIGSSYVFTGEQTFQAVNPKTGAALEPLFYEGTAQDVDRAVALAEKIFDTYRTTDNIKRGEFLETIAAELLILERALVDRAMLETGLPQARLVGEMGRTVNQLKLFSRLIKEGSYVEPRIDRALPDRSPIAKPDIRQMLIALGPVAVFGASNFPLAFSVAGGDTASALAAGCPVVVKGHPAHPGASELAGQAIQNAVKKCGLPKGVFSLVQGRGTEVGADLVKHPSIKAVAFTGSLEGGRALFDLASARPEPIPVYAEMGSVNPVFLLPHALQEQGDPLARNFVASVILGVGQFCTSPGLVFAIKGEALDAFMKTTEELFLQKTAETMLHAGIRKSFTLGIDQLKAIAGVEQVGSEQNQSEGCFATPVLLKTDVGTFFDNQAIGEEVFGPSSVVVVCNSREDLLAAARSLNGQLTATVHGSPTELDDYADLFNVLERKAGRILLNGFPTGVEVCDSMTHGGPYPASTDSRSTSVGTASIKRFLRPVCYQNFPQAVLPEPLKNKNEHNLWRRVDGTLTRDDVQEVFG